MNQNDKSSAPHDWLNTFSMDDLIAQKNKLAQSLEKSQGFLNDLELKKKDLEKNLKQKVWQNKIEQIRYEKTQEKKILEWLMKAEELFAGRHYEQVLEYCRNILSLDSYHIRARDLFGNATRKIEENKESYTLKEQIENQKSREKTEKISRVKIRMLEQHYEEALSLLNEIVLQYGTAVEIQEIQKECEKKLEDSQKKLETSEDIKNRKQIELKKLLHMARRSFYKKDYEKAIEFYEKILNLDPDHTEAAQGLLDTETTRKNDEEQKRENGEDNRKKYLYLRFEAERFEEQGEYDKAINLLNTILLEGCFSDADEIHKKIAQIKSTRQETQKKKTETEETRHQQEKNQVIFREKKYWDSLFKYELYIRNNRYLDALLLLRRIKTEYPEKNELEIKLHDTVQLLDKKEEEKRAFISLELENKNNLKKTLIDAQNLFLNGQLEESFELCRNILLVNKYYLVEAQDLVKKIESKRDQEKEALLKNREILIREDRNRKINFCEELQSLFRKSVISGDFKEAKIILEDLRLNASGLTDYAPKIENLQNYLNKMITEEQASHTEVYEVFFKEFNKSVQLYQTSQYWEAYLGFKKSLLINPEDEDAQQFKDMAYKAFQENEARRQNAQKEKEEFRKAFDLLKTRVAQYVIEKRFFEALSECEKMAVIYPGYQELTQELEYIQDKADAYELSEKEKKIKAKEEKHAQLHQMINDLLIKAKMEVKKMEFNKAFECYYEALRLDPGNKEISLQIEEAESLKIRHEVQLREEKERSQERRKSFHQLALQGDKEAIYGNYELAIEYYERALDIEPENENLKKTIKDLEIRIRERQQQEIRKKDEIQEKIRHLSLSATKLFFDHQYREALDICEQILTFDSQHQESFKLKDQILEMKTMEDKRIEEKQKAEEDHKRIEFHQQETRKQQLMAEAKSIYQGGLEYFRNNELEKAIQEWEKIQFVDPSNTFVLDEIRQAKLKIKQKEIEEYQKSEQKKENELKASQCWADGKNCFRREEYLKALECFERAVMLIGREKYLLDEIEKTQTLVQKKRLEEERERMLDEKKVKTLNHMIFMANRFYNNRQFDQSLEYYQKAFEIDPDNVEIKNGIINAELYLRNLNEGEPSSMMKNETMELDFSDHDNNENNRPV